MATLRSSEVKEGYMFKEGGNRRSWKKRYFVLKENKMEYFKAKGDTKVRGTISLFEGKGVRGKGQCKCKWPSFVQEEYCFGLATERRTFYFYTTAEEGNVGGWKSIIQEAIEQVGDPCSDHTKDHQGKPEESKSFIARKLVSVGSKVTKVAVQNAPVDDRVKKGVGAGADMVSAQADADPHTGVGQRVAMGVGGTSKVVKGTGVGGDVGKIVTDVVATGADIAKDACKKSSES